MTRWFGCAAMYHAPMLWYEHQVVPDTVSGDGSGGELFLLEGGCAFQVYYRLRNRDYGSYDLAKSRGDGRFNGVP